MFLSVHGILLVCLFTKNNFKVKAYTLYLVHYFTGTFDVDFCIMISVLFQDPDADYQDDEDDPAQKIEVNSVTITSHRPGIE